MGRRSLGKIGKTYNVSPETPDRLAALAIAMGFIYGYKDNAPIPAMGEFLDAIGDGSIKLIPPQAKNN